MPRHLLGLSAYAHDSAACLLTDGRVAALCEEERFTRAKHTGAFPRRAIAAVLAQAGLGIDDVAEVAFFLRPDLMRARMLAVARDHFPRSFFAFAPMLWGLRRLRRALTADLAAIGWRRPVRFVEHHFAHALSAFLPSPFERAAILTIDGKGEWAATTWGAGAGTSVRLTRELRYPHSLGYVYSVFTRYLGFRPWGGEGKLMGLAPYGTPRYRAFFDRLVTLRPDGGYHLHLDWFRFHLGLPWVHPRVVRALGPPRAPEAELTERHCDVAASVQDLTDRAVCHLARGLRAASGCDALCVAGGVGLNSAANGALVRAGIFRRHFFQPLAYDAGTAWGAALAAHVAGGGARPPPQTHAAFGDDCDEAAIADARLRAGAGLCWERPADVVEPAAAALAEGRTVGWFQGRAEVGPRALGQRSILADPRRADMKDHLNRRVKFRESFRPYAPSVPVERAREFFDLAEDAPYMIVVAPVRPERRAELPAVTHVDGSARVQTVDAAVLPLFHRLLTAFGLRTGVPVLLNTSFNRRGEPLVRTPAEALAMLRATALDHLALGPFFVSK